MRLLPTFERRHSIDATPTPLPRHPRVLMLVRNPLTHDSRVERAASFLAGKGYDVTVVAQHAASLARDERRSGFRIVRVAPTGAARFVAAVPRVETAVRRLLGTGGYYSAAVALGRRLRPDVVHCHDLDTLLPGSVVARLTGGRVVYDAHELWTERASLAHGRGAALARRRYATLERTLIRRADAVVTVNAGIAALLEQRYRIREPLVLLNTPSRVTLPGPRLRDSVGPGLRILLYVGGIQPDRGLEPALEALARLEGTALVLLGPAQPAALEALHRRAASLGVTDRFFALPPVLPEQVTAVAAQADVGLCLIPAVSESYRLTLPNKLFEYAIAGLPLVASDLPELRHWVTTHHLGALCNPESADEVTRAIGDTLERRVPLADAAERQQFRERFAWESEAEKLGALYVSLCGPADADLLPATPVC